MSNNLSNKHTKISKKWKTISFKVDEKDFDNTVERLSNLAANTVNSSGKLGVSYAELIMELLDNHLSNSKLKEFISRDFLEQTSAQNRLIDDLTVAINSLTNTVENLRNFIALTLSNGDVNAALSVINTVNSPAVVREKSGEDDFEFTTDKRADNDHFQNDDTSDLLAAFEQINVSNDSENGTDSSRVVTSFQTLKQPRNFKKRLNT
ncbi:hypothetical protein [Brucella gallinifaecis]|uniref:hypothetical protein n=1 Tax=Brucella gallinifaecis TaxID=215590 RepID=UPI002362A806|nr:hypothetical protein [Brucella gallinifaecis]